MYKRLSAIITVTVLILFISGCSDTQKAQEPVQTDSNIPSANTEATAETDVAVQFGNQSETFIFHPENNDTAAELVRNIGSSGKNLPIYHFDDFEGYEYMQYYDVPSSYTIPSEPENVTAPKAGEVYYSEPNRVILFYRDAQIEGDYTKIGTIENTEGLADAVENNPVLEGWGNKIISLNYVK